MAKYKLTSSRSIITDFTGADENFRTLFRIYRDTIEPGIMYDMFVYMYCSDELKKIDFTLFTSCGKDAGFSAVFIYATTLNKKPAYVIRSATGLLAEFQGKGLHDITDLYLKFIRFAFRHPFAPKYVAAFVINPIVFSQLCRFIPFLYPKPNVQVPNTIEAIIDEIVTKSNHKRNSLHPYMVEVPIQVKFTPPLLKRICSSKDENIQWFLINVPLFLKKHGLLTIVDISWKNVWGTILYLSRYNIRKKQKTAQRSFGKQARACRQKAAQLRQTILERIAVTAKKAVDKTIDFYTAVKKKSFERK